MRTRTQTGVAETWPRTALPVRLSSFVGRESEVRAVSERLGRTRLLTLTGPGGCGKTRLAHEVARLWPSEVVWVELAALGREGDVAGVVANALGVRPMPAQSVTESIAIHLADREALIVLDNCEHVVASAGGFCPEVVAVCPAVRILATSRRVLGIEGEERWSVPSLTLPRNDEPVLSSDAVQLFAERARLADTTFALDPSTVASVVDVCRRLDGMPLAIEFAAARLSMLSLQQVADRLDDSLGLGRRQSPATPSRQRTLHASIEWSLDLLDVDERVLLRRLAVFAGGFSLPMVEMVCADPPLQRSRILELLESLTSDSLVSVVTRDPVGWYRLLEPVRQFMAEELRASGEADALRDRHRDVMVAIAEEQQTATLTPEQPGALAVLDHAAPNMAAAIDHATATDADIALRMCVALDMWWRMRGSVRERAIAFDRALAAGDPRPSALRCRALISRAWLFGNEGELQENVALGTFALDMAEQLDDAELVMHALLGLGNSQMNTDAGAAREALVRCWVLAERSGDEWVLVRCAITLAYVAWYRQDLADQLRWTDGLDARLRRLGDRGTHALVLVAEAGIRYARLELGDSVDDLRTAAELAHEVSDPFAECCAGVLLCLVDCTSGRAHQARAEIESIRGRVAAMGGTTVSVWVSLVSAIACRADGEESAGAAELAAIVAGEVGFCRMPQIWARIELAETLRLTDDPRATHHAATALDEARAFGNPWLVARARILLGRLAARDDRWAEADVLQHEALDAIVEHQLDLELPTVLEALAEVAEARRSADETARLLAAADAFRRERSLTPRPDERTEIETLASRVGADDLPSVDVEEVVGWVRRTRGRRGRPDRGWESLTPVELDVSGHVAAGLTNPEIGRRMFISTNTVKTHLAHVFDKLQITSRAELAVMASTHGP